MKQTAVEWLQEQLECFGNKHELQMSWATVDELLKQAKEMEKQQIIDAYADGIDYDYTDLDIEFGIAESDRQNHAEQYYNETFNK